MINKRIISWILLLALLAIIYSLHPDIFKEILRIKQITIFNLLVISTLCVGNQFLLGLEIKVLCRSFGVRVDVIESFSLSSVRAIANYLPMGAGVISNAVYLKSQKKLSIADYSSSLTVSFVLMFLITGFIGFVASLYLNCSANVVGWDIILLFFIVFIASLAVMKIKFPMLESDSFLGRFIRNYQKGYALLTRDGHTIRRLVILKLLILLLLIIKLKLLFVSVGYDLSWGSIILIVMSVVAFRIATILPGNIGITESISGFMTAVSGGSFEDGFAGMAVDRIIQLIWIIVLGIVSILYLSKKIKTVDIFKP